MKTFNILVSDERLKPVYDTVLKRLTARGMELSEEAEFTLVLETDEAMRPDSYRITGKPEMITIKADSLINVFAGVGVFLYSSKFDENGIIPSEKRGYKTPDCSERCVYTATHFHTFYWMAPLSEVFDYYEDLALMGINRIHIGMPFLGVAEGNKEIEDAFSHLAEIQKFIKSLGMKLSTSVATSCTFLPVPDEAKTQKIFDPYGLRCEHGNKACPSTEVGQEILDKQNRMVLGEYKKRGVEIDMISTFPYDEGGCGCEKCSPWGGNGYIKAAKRAKKVARELFPDCKLTVSTWLFDSPPSGEWEGLSKSLENEKWCDAIEADSHTKYPRYPIDVKVPGGLPLTAFPEISMWGLWPWGGYGASFFPKRYTKLFRATEGKLDGGRMYSEGIFEDLNKYVVSGLYKDFNNDPEKAVAEYASYHFGLKETEKFVEMVNLIEENHVKNYDRVKINLTPENNLTDFSLAERALALAKEIDGLLPEWGKKSWRWRLMFIRANIDYHRYNNEVMHENPEVVTLMHEIMDIYHCIKDYSVEMDPEHFKLRPPLPATDNAFDIKRYTRTSIGIAYNNGLINVGKPIEHIKENDTMRGNEA